MRFLMIVSLLLCALLALGIGAARAVGHRNTHLPFPVPDARACWQGVCPFAIPDDDVPDTVAFVPGASHINSYRVISETGGDDTVMVTFDYTPDAQPPAPILMSLNSVSYTLLIDQMADTRRSMMRLGDALVRFGPPDRIQVAPSVVWLLYDQPRLGVLVRTGPRPLYTVVRLTLDLPVTGFMVGRPGHLMWNIGGSRSEWQGLGEYVIHGAH